MAEKEKEIIDDIISKRRLPYSIELLEVSGDKYTVLTNFGSKICYIKKEDDYIPAENEK